MEITSNSVSEEFEDAVKCIEASRYRRSMEAFANLTRLMNRTVVEEGSGIITSISDPRKLSKLWQPIVPGWNSISLNQTKKSRTKICN